MEHKAQRRQIALVAIDAKEARHAALGGVQRQHAHPARPDLTYVPQTPDNQDHTYREITLTP